MAIEIEGVTYYAVRRALVVDATNDPQENLAGGQIYATIGGEPLPLANEAGVPMTEIVTSPGGFTSDMYVAFPEEGPLEGWLEWGDDGIPPQSISATNAEVGDRLARTAGVSDALAAAVAAAEAAAADAQRAADQYETKPADVVEVVAATGEAVGSIRLLAVPASSIPALEITGEALVIGLPG